MKKYLKRNGKTILKAIAIVTASITAYVILHNIATAQRGYEAIGGELFVAFLILFAEDLIEIIKAPFKAGKNYVDR